MLNKRIYTNICLLEIFISFSGQFRDMEVYSILSKIFIEFFFGSNIIINEFKSTTHRVGIQHMPRSFITFNHVLFTCEFVLIHTLINTSIIFRIIVFIRIILDIVIVFISFTISSLFSIKWLLLVRVNNT